ncbi:MAG TPA: hypothetical protein VFR27_18460 [Mycobacterium sp.]|nr:hypothetical protein [Mycobacterium sp.]
MKTNRSGHLVGRSVAVGILLGGALMPLVAAPAAQADGGVISCIVGEGCTVIPAPGVPIGENPSPPTIPSGPPEVISCIINQGCSTYPGSGDIGQGGDHGPGDPGVPGTDPFGWFFQDLSALSNWFDSLVADLFKF